MATRCSTARSRDVKAEHGARVVALSVAGEVARRRLPTFSPIARSSHARTTRTVSTRSSSPPGADAQVLLRRVVETGRADSTLRAGAAVAAPDLPGKGRRHWRRGGDEWPGLTCASSAWCSAANTSSACAPSGSSSARCSARCSSAMVTVLSDVHLHAAATGRRSHEHRHRRRNGHRARRACQ